MEKSVFWKYFLGSKDNTCKIWRDENVADAGPGKSEK